MKAKAELANADASSWLFNPNAAAKFAGTEKSTGTGIYLQGDDGKTAGVQSYATNQVPNEAGTPETGGSEEHTSELQSLMRNSYAVFCLKQKNTQQQNLLHT